jgi:hypothetical protein
MGASGEISEMEVDVQIFSEVHTLQGNFQAKRGGLRGTHYT